MEGILESQSDEGRVNRCVGYEVCIQGSVGVVVTIVVFNANTTDEV
jgi:hypothetical protein